MQFLNRLYGWYGKRVVLGFFAVALLLIICGIIFSLGSKPEPAAQTETTPTVTVRAVNEIADGSSFDVVGTVAAVDEARLQAETGGRITDVRVEIGDRVAAGTVLATIENASQYASLLQAEGAYESAQAAALSSGVSLETSETNVENLYRDSFTTAESIIRNTADQVISNPRSQFPGIRIDASGHAPQLSDTRVEIETMLENWGRDIENNFSGLSEEEMLRRTERNLNMVSAFVADLSFYLANEKPSEVFPEASLAALRTSFASARASLDGSLASVASTRREYEQAQISAGSDTVTETSARLKSALGTLRSAQAAYEQTIVRSPIAGSVNALYLKEGTYVAPGTPAAVVANNGSLEITTSVGEGEGARIKVGDAVRIENTADGVVTAIAPAIDPMTGKISVKIGVDDDNTLENGSTVRVSFLMEADQEESDEILVPLTALKITPEGAVVFEVGTDNTLKPVSVTLGPVRGDLVLIEEGLTGDSRIVVDARGLKEGETVQVQ